MHIFTHINVYINIYMYTHIWYTYLQICIGRRDDGVSSDRCEMEGRVVACRLAHHPHF